MTKTRTKVSDCLIEWDDYFGGWVNLSSIQSVKTPPDQIEIIHPDHTEWNVIAYLHREVKDSNGNITKWMYDITMKDASTYMFTLMNE